MTFVITEKYFATPVNVVGSPGKSFSYVSN